MQKKPLKQHLLQKRRLQLKRRLLRRRLLLPQLKKHQLQRLLQLKHQQPPLQLRHHQLMELLLKLKKHQAWLLNNKLKFKHKPRLKHKLKLKPLLHQHQKRRVQLNLLSILKKAMRPPQLLLPLSKLSPLKSHGLRWQPLKELPRKKRMLN
jgi:hypothetical protein